MKVVTKQSIAKELRDDLLAKHPDASSALEETIEPPPFGEPPEQHIDPIVTIVVTAAVTKVVEVAIEEAVAHLKKKYGDDSITASED